MGPYRFPFAEMTRKACIVIMRARGKKKMDKFDSSKIVEITSVRCHRENATSIKLPKGDYIISCSVFKQGETGKFALEVYIPDELKIASDDLKAHERLKNSVFERLENKTVQCVRLNSQITG